MSCKGVKITLQSKEKGAVCSGSPTPSNLYTSIAYTFYQMLSKSLMCRSQLSVDVSNCQTKQWLWCPHSIHDLDENLLGKGEEAYCLPTELTRRLKQYVLQPRKCNGGLDFGISRRLKSRKDNLVHGHCLHLVSDFLQDYSIPVSRKVERGVAINNERKVK